MLSEILRWENTTGQLVNQHSWRVGKHLRIYGNSLKHWVNKTEIVLDCPEGMFSKVMVPILLFFEVHFIFGFFYFFHPQKIDLGIDLVLLLEIVVY